MAMQAMKAVMVPFLVISSVDGETKSLTEGRLCATRSNSSWRKLTIKSLTVPWSEREAIGEKIHQFMVEANIDQQEWMFTFKYADGSILPRGSELEELEEHWPVTIEFTKLSSLSDSDAAKHNEEETERKKQEEKEEARHLAEAQEQARKEKEEKERKEAVEREEREISERAMKEAADAAAREAEEARLAAEEAELEKEKEDEQRLAAEQARKEAEEAAEAARKAKEAEDAAKAAALEKEAEDKRKAEEEQRRKAKEAERKRIEAEENRKRQEEQAKEAARKQEEALKEAAFKEELAKKRAEANKPRNLQWRWEQDYVPLMGMVSKQYRSMFGDEKWIITDSRDELKKQLNEKAEDPQADSPSLQYKKRKVEFADVEYPERRKVFENYAFALEWLMLEWNIAPKDEL